MDENVGKTKLRVVSRKFADLTSPEAPPTTSSSCRRTDLSEGDRRRGPDRPDPTHLSLQRCPPVQPAMAMPTVVARAAVGAVVGAGVALVGVPAAIGALGFTAGGIAAGSVAAKMMSAAAIANGGGVAAGSVVAVLQSVGAAGVPTAVQAALTGIGAATGAAIGSD